MTSTYTQFKSEIYRLYENRYFLDEGRQGHVACDDQLQDYGYPEDPHWEPGYRSSLDADNDGSVDLTDHEILKLYGFFKDHTGQEFLRFSRRFFANECLNPTTVADGKDAIRFEVSQQQADSQGGDVVKGSVDDETIEKAHDVVRTIFDEDLENDPDYPEIYAELDWCYIFWQVENHEKRDEIYEMISQIDRSSYEGYGERVFVEKYKRYFFTVVAAILDKELEPYGIARLAHHSADPVEDGVRLKDVASYVTTKEGHVYTFDELFAKCDF